MGYDYSIPGGAPDWHSEVSRTESTGPADGSSFASAAALGTATAPSPVNLDLIDQALQKGPGLDTKGWDLLLGTDPLAPGSGDARALLRPAAVAGHLAASWNAVGLPDSLTPSFLSAPPSGLPPEIGEMLRFIGANPALLSAIDGSDGWGALNDGTIWRFDLEDFATGTAADLEQATAALTDYRAASAPLDARAQIITQDAAIIAANRRLAAAAGAAEFGAPDQAPISDRISTAGLRRLAEANPGLAPALLSATQRFVADNVLDRVTGNGEFELSDAETIGQFIALAAASSGHAAAPPPGQTDGGELGVEASVVRFVKLPR